MDVLGIEVLPLFLSLIQSLVLYEVLLEFPCFFFLCVQRLEVFILHLLSTRNYLGFPLFILFCSLFLLKENLLFLFSLAYLSGLFSR